MNKLGFLIFLAIFVSINFYLFIRGRQALPKDTVIQTLYTVLFTIMAVSFFVAFTLEGKLPPLIIAIFENVGGFWMISFLYFLVAVLLADIVRLADFAFGIFPESFRANYAQVKLIYLGTVMLVLFVFSAIGYYRFSNPATVNLNIDIPVKGSAGTLSVVAVSDVHLGNLIRKGRLVKYVNLINRQNPDVILIVGDLFDRNLRTVEWQHMDKELQKLKARFGVYMVLGNHDYFGNVNKAIEIINRSGIKLLRDTTTIIDNRLVLIGRDDRTNHRRMPLKNLVAGVNGQLPTLLLDHQPQHLNEAVENNINVQISGHTHNGQIYPMSRLVARIYELGYGYKKTGNTHFYVSSGLGLWGAPIRLGTQSEIVKLKLNFVPDGKK